MNAVSLYTNARQDTGVQLRQTVYANLADYSIRTLLRHRWQSDREWQNANIPDGGLYYTEEVLQPDVIFLDVHCHEYAACH